MLYLVTLALSFLPLVEDENFSQQSFIICVWIK